MTPPTAQTPPPPHLNGEDDDSSLPLVILSVAKDLMPVATGDEVLRYAQDDKTLSGIWRGHEASSFVGRRRKRL